MKPTLVVLAAGMGSRYGGLKQMDAFGPNGETIIEYSIYDAIRAGFGKVVFVIRDFFKKDFEELFAPKLEGKIEYAFVTQEITKIPDGYDIHPERQKPWGTAHAVYVAKDEVKGPFAVINADDYYGKESYQAITDYFIEFSDYCLVGYFLRNTLSDHGTVNRGICASDTEGNLATVIERTKIKQGEDGVVRYTNSDTDQGELDINSLVSMNMWGFTKDYFEYFEKYFGEFLKANGMILKSEYYIPKLIDDLIRTKQKEVKVLETESEWFGVTYQEDKPVVIEKINNLLERKVYPEVLWK